MKTVQQLQQEVYQQALTSGYFKSMQAQLKSYVFDLIQKEYGSKAKGFQYQHPLLGKLKQYPLTSLCLDLIQQFLQSFKFKHTLNIFKKEINRSHNIPRKTLAEQFRIEIKNPQSQAVLVSIVNQMTSGEVGALKEPMKDNYLEKKNIEPTNRNNYFMNQPPKSMGSTQATAKIVQPPMMEKPAPANQNSSINISGSSSVNEPKGSSISMPSKIDSSPSNLAPSAEVSVNSNADMSAQSSEVKPQKQQKKQKEEKKGKEDKKKKKVQKQKPPEGAKDLLGDVMKKFEGIAKVNKQEEKKSLFDSKRAFSEQKQIKVADPSQTGANKIRGISAGKPMSSLMSKFMPQAAQQPKNQSYIDQQLDQFQQSKDSTRRNPLFSSSESGFEKSGFDYSVDSNSIEQYEYNERAKRVSKKL